jgi:integrase/recombinase XerD
MATRVDLKASQASFLDHLRVERGLAQNTILSYTRDISYFLLYLESKKISIENLSADNLAEFEVSLKDKGLALSSINRVNSTVKSFLIYMAREFSLNLPTGEISSHRIARKLPKALSIDEITALISSSGALSRSNSLRDVAMLELLYSTGGRVSEIIGVNLSDLAKVSNDDEVIQTIRLRGKGSKERIVPVGSFALQALDNYLVRLRPALAEYAVRDDGALFLNSRGRRISRQSAWTIVSEAAKLCGLENKVSPHALRHSYATHLLDGGADIRVVQELLGHSSVTTTQIYTLVTIDRLRQSYASAHPRAQ